MKKYTIKAVFKISTKPVLMSKTGNEILLSALVEYFQYFYFTGNLPQPHKWKAILSIVYHYTMTAVIIEIP